MLNSEHLPFCLDSHTTSVNLPIRINQTSPKLIELLRFDLDSNQEEILTISAKQSKQLKRQADKGHAKSDTATPRDLLYPVKKTGIYRLQRVTDESNLEVQRKMSDTLVVACPSATIKTAQRHKCMGDLSDLILEVIGTPPLKIRYSQKVNNVDKSRSFQSIQPENLLSPLMNERMSGSLVDPKNLDMSWGRSRKIEVPLNESLTSSGEWFYAIEEVHDALGNVASYSWRDQADQQQLAKNVPQIQFFSVHERPRISLEGCNVQDFLKVAKEDSIEMPLRFHSTGNRPREDFPCTLDYSFLPQLSEQGPGHEVESRLEKVILKSKDYRPRIGKPGWYSLEAISSQFCAGEVLEPATCLLHNPPEPDLSIKAENISDNCAGNPIGLLVDLDLIGSPPFRIRYNIEHEGSVRPVIKVVDFLRGQLELKPSEAGKFRYTFLEIGDSIYTSQSLKDKNLVLEQDVRPPPSAHFKMVPSMQKACFEEPIHADAQLYGEGPWNLQYEMVHNGKRKKYEANTDDDLYHITTEKTLDGGEYTLLLTSVMDRSGCKMSLNDDTQIEVRPEKPKASFGQIDRKRAVLSLAGQKVKLPLRLTGEAPWTIIVNGSTSGRIERTLWNANDHLEVDQPGTYEIVEIRDTCPGSVDRASRKFDVSWIPRPSISVADSSSVRFNDPKDGKVSKFEVCEGDEDALELKFSGSPPYTGKYEVHQDLSEYRKGVGSVRKVDISAALGSVSIPMDTSKAGTYLYSFTELGDNLYSHDPKAHHPLFVRQVVNPRPSARFESPGRSYGYCKEDASGEELVPIVLDGVPPFSLEISIKHHNSVKPEILSIPNITSKKHNLPIPRRHLELGLHTVSIRKVRDGRGCQRTSEYDATAVRLLVSDVPTIIPLESQVDYCVGDRISYSLSGHPPFDIFYTFEDKPRKASSSTTNFRRIAEKPGDFTITAVSDGASGKCKANKEITKVIHPMPSVKVSKGRESVVDIHEGGEAEILFEFTGTPPFEFT